MFEYLSSPMRWCESKFLYSIYIAEFWNSLSSIIISLYGFYGLYVHNDVNDVDKIPWKILIFIGLSSFWFHSTLSFLGQFFDELGIILLVTYCIKNIYKLTNFNYWLIITLLSLVSWFIPSSSPFIFIISGTLLTLLTYYKIKDNSEELWFRCIKFGLISVFLWILDFICITNTHTYWHITIGYTAYLMIIYVQNENNKFKINDSLFPKIIYKK